MLDIRGARAVPIHAGTDIIVVENGRIAALYLFFDPLPVKDVA
ncbi:hypothetical protein [Gluconacetobacter tumulicola]|nr:hypothetical protein [Gluconacetobacter tumulicola]